MHTVTRHRQSGVGLIEVLVTVIITAVGLLGVASMYVTTISAKTTSLSRTRAVYLAHDMAERIYVNPTGGVNYVLAWGGATPAQDCSNANCNNAQIAATDLNEWNTLLTTPYTGLLNGQGNITYTASTAATIPDVYVVSVRWTEKGFGQLQVDYPIEICNRTTTTVCSP